MLVVSPALLWTVLNYRFIAHEERTMAERFGEEYLRYRRGHGGGCDAGCRITALRAGVACRHGCTGLRGLRVIRPRDGPSAGMVGMVYHGSLSEPHHSL